MNTRCLTGMMHQDYLEEWTPMAIPDCGLGPLAGGNQVRLRLSSHTSTNTVLAHIAIVERSPGTSNGTTTPTEVLVDGSSGVTLVAGALDIWTDWITFTIDSRKQYLVIFDHTASTTSKYRYGGGSTMYEKAATESYNTQNLSGAAGSAYACICCEFQVRTV